METTNALQSDIETSKKELPQPNLLTLPREVREKIYTFLHQPDCLVLRQVCQILQSEVDNFFSYNVAFVYKEPENINPFPVPFCYLNSLRINNDANELPWGDCEEDRVKSLVLDLLTYKTFRVLGQITSVRDVLLRSGAFKRTIPQLNWNLKELSIEFVVNTPQAEEGYMLDNLDSLLIQNFGNLEDLTFVACNQMCPNVQKQYALRGLRFLAKHSKKLKHIKIILTCLPCVTHDYAPDAGDNAVRTTSALNEEENRNLEEIQVESLALYVSEVVCPLCYHWQKLIRQQKKLKSLQLYVNSASRLPTNFFCSSTRGGFEFLESLTVRLWGLASYRPFDCRHLSEAVHLRFLEICRYAPQRFAASEGELLNTHFLPEGLTHVNFVGLLVSSDRVNDIFLQLKNIKRLVCIECCAAVGTGFNTSHIQLVGQHENLTDLMIDFHSPIVGGDSTVFEIEQALNAINVEYTHFQDQYGSGKQRFWIGKYDRDEGARADVAETVAFLTEYSVETTMAVRSLLNTIM